MPVSLSEVFGALSQVMGLCPCCGELFYASEARPTTKVRSLLRRSTTSEPRNADWKDWSKNSRSSSASSGAGPPKPGCAQRNGCYAKSTPCSAVPATTPRT
jgi:hypothetical protein